MKPNYKAQIAGQEIGKKLLNSGEAIRGDFMNKQAMAVRIAARWLRKMEADPRVLNFYEALQATTQAGFQLQKILKGHPQEELVLQRYPTSIPPFDVYLRELYKWQQAQRNAIRAFAQEGERRQASPLNLVNALKAYGLAYEKFVNSWNNLYGGRNMPSYVEQKQHIKGLTTANPVYHWKLIKKWILQTVADLTGKQKLSLWKVTFNPDAPAPLDPTKKMRDLPDFGEPPGGILARTISERSFGTPYNYAIVEAKNGNEAIKTLMKWKGHRGNPSTLIAYPYRGSEPVTVSSMQVL